MADGTAIEWTHRPGTKGETWNPIRARHRATGKVGWHCETVSEGCRNCYAAAQNLNRRNLAFGTGLPYKPGHRRDVEIIIDERTLTAPLRWRAPRTIFVCSMTDAFGSFVNDRMLDLLFAVAAICPQHVFIFVTKRPARMRSYVQAIAGDELEWKAWRVTASHLLSALGRGHEATGDGPRWPLPNVWLLVSAEDQATADERIPELLATPAAVRGLSAEPLLGPINFARWLQPACGRCPPWETPCRIGCEHVTRLQWIIGGGESGDQARAMHPDLPRSLRDQCAAAGAAFFFKQWGAWAWAPEWMTYAQAEAWAKSINAKRIEHHSSGHTAIFVGKRAAGRLLDGREHNAFPKGYRDGPSF